MNISPINYSYTNYTKHINNALSTAVKNNTQQASVKKYANIPLHVYKQKLSNLSFSNKYSYTPISSKVPISELVGNYDNLDKFSELFAKKINSQLMIPDENDIKNLVSRIKKATGAKEDEILKVLTTLTAFSDYKAFSTINKITQDYFVGEFGLKDTFNKDPLVFDFSSNSAVNYLIDKKHFANYYQLGLKGYILDDISLSQLEKYKNSSDASEQKIYNNFLQDILDEKILFFNIKGWDIKTKANGYKNANFLSGSGYLEDLAVEVIKRIKDGENPDNIYYSDFKKRLFNLFDNEELKKHVLCFDISPDTKENPTQNDILKALSPKKATKETIKAIIEKYIEIKKVSYPKNKVQQALLKYLDEQTRTYSIDSLALALKNINKNLEQELSDKGFDKNKIIYLLPEELKSFSLISTMYAQINNIKAENLISLYNIPESKQCCAKVILDDISSSGVTESKVCYDYRINYRKNGTPLIYAPVIICAYAQNSDQRSPDSYPDKYYCDNSVNDLTESFEISELIKKTPFEETKKRWEDELLEFTQTNSKNLTQEDCQILNEILYKGYSANAISVCFPYMIPDNSSDISSHILGRLLYNENVDTNKLWIFLQKRQRMIPDEYLNYIKIRELTKGGLINEN